MQNPRRKRWLYDDSASRRRFSGREAAERHIEEANRLSRELGHTDQLVKDFLFKLSDKELDHLFKEYGRKYGSSPESYARETIPRWRSGRVAMSGLVAERLYGLLPPRMPLKLKYDIAEKLWRHVGPSSDKTLRFGPGVLADEVITIAGEHISSVVVNYKIPATLEKQFNWLASDDVTVKHQLLNHLQNWDKQLVVESVRLHAGVMAEHLLDRRAKQTRSFTHTVRVGNHNLKIVADVNAQGCAFEEPEKYPRKKSSSFIGWEFIIFTVVVIGGVLLMSIVCRPYE